MGTDYETHLGPYIECKLHKVDDTDTERTCTNKKCKEHRRKVWDSVRKFCSTCGSPIADQVFPIKTDSTDAGEMREKLSDALVRPFGDELDKWQNTNNTHIWLSNRTSTYRSSSFDPRCGMQFQEITPKLIAKELAQFEKDFSKELSELREAYGIDLVEVKWGLLHSIY